MGKQISIDEDDYDRIKAASDRWDWIQDKATHSIENYLFHFVLPSIPLTDQYLADYIDEQIEKAKPYSSDSYKGQLLAYVDKVLGYHRHDMYREGVYTGYMNVLDRLSPVYDPDEEVQKAVYEQAVKYINEWKVKNVE